MYKNSRQLDDGADKLHANTNLLCMLHFRMYLNSQCLDFLKYCSVPAAPWKDGITSQSILIHACPPSNHPNLNLS